MSDFMITPDPAAVINVGKVTSYADAVAGGYQGTREEWEIVLANLGTTAAEVEANRQAVAEDKAAVEGDVTTVGEYKDVASAAAAAALQSAESAHTDALAATAAKEAAQTAQGIAEEARADAVSAKGAAESAQTEANASASAATEAALAAGNAAETATANAGAASDSATAAAASAASVSGVVTDVTAAKTEALAAIEAKGAETLDSIPDDYTELSGDVADLKSAINDDNQIYALTLRDLYARKQYPYVLKWRSGTKSSPNRTDYATSVNQISIRPGDTVIFGGKSAPLNKITLYNFDKNGVQLGSVKLTLSGTSGEVTWTGVKISSETSDHIIFEAWTGNSSVAFDTDLYADWFYVFIANSASETNSLNRYVTSNDYETGARKNVPCIWHYGYMSGTGTPTALDREDYIHTFNSIPCSAGDIVTIDFTASPKIEGMAHRTRCYWYDETDTYISYNQKNYSSATQSFYYGMTFTAPENAKFCRFEIWTNSSSVLWLLQDTEDILIYVNRARYSLAQKTDTLSLHDNSGKTYTTHVLGAKIPADAPHKYARSDTYISTLKSAIEQWMTAYAGDQAVIPLVIHTDQHGSLTWQRKPVFDLLSYLVNWQMVSGIFDLGDTVSDHWGYQESGIYLTNSALENALYCLEGLPDDKRVNVFGNHDVITINESNTYRLPHLKYLNQYFPTGKSRTIKLPDNSGNMVVYDDTHMVKYLVIGSWDIRATVGETYGGSYINAEHWRWIIRQLGVNDGYDIVVTSHIPVIYWSNANINPITNVQHSVNTSYISSKYADSQAPFAARRNKTSGTITVGGETIAFDFTNCETELLCAISGHTHEDLVDRIGGVGGVLQASFDRFSADTNVLHFVLIDRNDNKLKTWKFSATSADITVNTWEADF